MATDPAYAPPTSDGPIVVAPGPLAVDAGPDPERTAARAGLTGELEAGAGGPVEAVREPARAGA